jgi:hypothetical protein
MKRLIEARDLTSLIAFEIISILVELLLVLYSVAQQDVEQRQKVSDPQSVGKQNRRVAEELSAS